MFLCYPKTDLNLRWNQSLNRNMITNAIFFSNSWMLKTVMSFIRCEYWVSFNLTIVLIDYTYDSESVDDRALLINTLGPQGCTIQGTKSGLHQTKADYGQ